MGIELRPYQKEGIRSIAESLRVKNATLYQLPTGGGKSTILAEIVRLYRRHNNDKRVVVLAHRKELIRQLHHRLGDFGITSWALYGGIEKHPEYAVQVASVQTLGACKLSEWPDDVGLIITDECHHATATSYKKIYERYPDSLLFGVTATPCRTDGSSLSDVFGKLILGPSPAKLISDGHLCEYDYYRGISPRLAGVKKNGGDYNLKELGDRVNEGGTELLGNLIDAWQKYANGLRTVVFAVNVEHSMSIRERFRSIGVACEHLDGKTPGGERDAVLARFGTGETTVLTNVGIISEGFDVPSIECVQLARPTKSLALYLQCVGRALRPHGDKRAIILDHGDCYSEFGLPCDDRKWSLEGRVKNCEYTPPEPSEDKVIKEVVEQAIIEQTAVFEKITAAKDEQEKIEQNVLRIVAKQQKNGCKPTWAYHRLIEHHGHELELGHLKALAKHLGYKWQWAVHKYEEFTSGHLATEEDIPW